MELLDRYVAEVGKNLPRRTRTDIEAELRSTLQDVLEDRSRETGRPVDDELTSDILKEYGAPAKVAAAYKTNQYVVGPRLFPTFEMVLKIVLAVLAVVSLVGLVISIVSTTMSAAELAMAIFRSAGQLLVGSITAFGNIVIVFAILERTLPRAEFEEKAKAWDPASLAREPDPDQTKRGELISEVVFTIIALVVFNFYPQVIGIPIVVDGHLTIVPLLSEAFFVYLPWLNTLWLLVLVLDVVLLRAEVWTLSTRLAKIGLSLATIALAYVMLTGPGLVSVTPDALALLPIGDAVGPFTAALDVIPRIVLGIVIIANTVEVFRQVYRLIVRRPGPVLPTVK